MGEAQLGHQASAEYKLRFYLGLRDVYFAAVHSAGSETERVVLKETVETQNRSIQIFTRSVTLVKSSVTLLLRMDGSAAEQCALEAWLRPPLIPWQQLRQLEAAQREIEALRCEVAPTDEHGASSRIQHAAASLARVQTVEPKLPCALR